MVVSAEAAQNLEGRVADTLRRHGPVSLHATEAELTSWLALNAAGMPLADPVVSITGGRLLLGASVFVGGTRRLSAVIAPVAVRGALQVRLERGTLDGRHLPRFVIASLEQAANAALSDAAISTRVDAITLDEGSLTIDGFNP